MSISKSRTGQSLIWGIKHMFLEQGLCSTGQSFHHALKSYAFVLRYRVLMSKTTNQSVRKAHYKMCVKITVLYTWARILRQELLVQSHKSSHRDCEWHAGTSGITYFCLQWFAWWQNIYSHCLHYPRPPADLVHLPGCPAHQRGWSLCISQSSVQWHMWDKLCISTFRYTYRIILFFFPENAFCTRSNIWQTRSFISSTVE